MLKVLKASTLAAVVFMATVGASHAATIYFDYGLGSDSSNGADLGTSATLEVNFTDVGGDVELSLSATNTSDATTGGFLTAFGFVLPSVDSVLSFAGDLAYPAITGFSGTKSLAEFSITLDAGAGTGGVYEGGGAPSGGIAIGSTGVFSFLLDTTETADSLESLFLATDPNSAVRFRGLLDGGSDKLTNTTTTTTPVPLPAAGWLLIAGLGGLAAASRRRG